MSAVSRLSSPSANLLRNSRLFALPQPLAPSVTNASSTPINHSDTATTPYPTHAAIETYRESRNKGDWGLKRPLPLKSTAGRDASFIRIKDGIDTREHITNFEQAGDHVWTLRKFQALNIPVLFEATTRHLTLGEDRTPFEERFINTAGPDELREGAKRWRMKGPWIAGMSNADFENWLHGSSVHGGALGEKGAFIEFLKKSFQRLLAAKDFARTILIEAGANDPVISEKERLSRVTSFLEAKLPSSLVLTPTIKSIVAVAGRVYAKDDLTNLLKILDEESLASLVPDPEDEMVRQKVNDGLSHYIRELRASPNDLLPLIQEFFDLPDTPSGPRGGNGEADLQPWAFGYGIPLKESNLANPRYRESGMPKTHPSAGLGYLRLGQAVMENHSVYGPQALPSSVPARVLKPGLFMQGASANAVLGAAGFVTSMSLNDDQRSQPKDFISQRGGQKMAIIPQYMSINPDGRPVLWTSSSNHGVHNDRHIMAGIAHLGQSQQAVERGNSSRVRGFDQMPEMDGGYQPNNQRVSEALRQSREGMRRMTNSTGGQGSAGTQKQLDVLNSIMDAVNVNQRR